MTNQERTTLVILGAGKGGSSLLELFSHLDGVEIIGIADTNPSAPGLKRAEELHIPVTPDPLTLIQRPGVNLIVNVTGDPAIDRVIAEHKQPETEVLGGAGSKILWDLVRHESQMQAQLFQAEKLARLGTFASGIAHDINNPLYIIMAFAEAILEETDLASIHSQAKSILEAGKRINGICRNITQYARASKDLDLHPVEVTEKLDEALKIARYATGIRDLSIVKNYADHVTVFANPDELLHVFVNLMTNAIHAMGDHGTLTLASWQQNGVGKIAISDTGSGIPQEHLDKIFDPFFTTKPAGKGTGLGLYSVKTIVRKYHGELQVESELGKGTTFHIALPATTKA